MEALRHLPREVRVTREIGANDDIQTTIGGVGCNA
jgi:hypothetical protein